MARLEIDFSEPAVFSLELDVRVGDVNYGQHLGNDRVLLLAQEVRVRWLKSLGASEASVEDGVGLLMTDAALVYLGQAFMGDVLRGELSVTEVGRAGFVLLYRFTRPADGREIARVRTGLVAYDYTRQKIARLPAVFRAALPSARPPV